MFIFSLIIFVVNVYLHAVFPFRWKPIMLSQHACLHLRGVIVKRFASGGRNVIVFLCTVHYELELDPLYPSDAA